MQAKTGELALHVTCAHARRRRHVCVDLLQRLIPLIHGAAVVGHHVALRRELFCRQGQRSRWSSARVSKLHALGRASRQCNAALAHVVRTSFSHGEPPLGACGPGGGLVPYALALFPAPFPHPLLPGNAASVLCRRMSAAGAAAPAAAAGEVPTSAPELRDVSDAPAGEALRTYETQLGADELLRQFLSEVSEVARDSEVVRCVCRAPRCWLCLMRRDASQGRVLLQAEPLRAPQPALRLYDRRGQAAISQGAHSVPRPACLQLTRAPVCADIAAGAPRQVQAPSCPRSV